MTKLRVSSAESSLSQQFLTLPKSLHKSNSQSKTDIDAWLWELRRPDSSNEFSIAFGVTLCTIRNKVQ